MAQLLGASGGKGATVMRFGLSVKTQLPAMLLVDERTLSRLGRGRQLRIGFCPVRPWCYCSSGQLRGRDIEACLSFARYINATPVFVACCHSDLVARLKSNQIDIGVGGLVTQEYDGIRCISSEQIPAIEGIDRRRRVFFPTVWWAPRERRLWCATVALFLWTRRLSLRRVQL